MSVCFLWSCCRMQFQNKFARPVVGRWRRCSRDIQVRERYRVLSLPVARHKTVGFVHDWCHVVLFSCFALLVVVAGAGWRTSHISAEALVGLVLVHPFLQNPPSPPVRKMAEGFLRNLFPRSWAAVGIQSLLTDFDVLFCWVLNAAAMGLSATEEDCTGRISIECSFVYLFFCCIVCCCMHLRACLLKCSEVKCRECALIIGLCCCFSCSCFSTVSTTASTLVTYGFTLRQFSHISWRWV